MVHPVEPTSSSLPFQAYVPAQTYPEGTPEYWMQRCLLLAQEGWASARPNPMVGCVVLDETRQVAGMGYHVKPGEPHAEVVALREAGDLAQGGTLYVNLEPCNHHGRTPPCTEAVLQSEVKNVVVGCVDSNPKVNETGLMRLRQHGVTVTTGVLEADARQLNQMFLYPHEHGKPFVTLKLAMSADGRIATRGGNSQWLTGEASRRNVHEVRQGYCALLTTAQTVAQDDAALTVRYGLTPPHPPVRIVLDRRFRLNPQRYRVFQTAEAPTWVFTARGMHNARHHQQAVAQGVQVFEVGETGIGLDLNDVFATLHQQGVMNVMAECGGTLAGELLRGDWVQQVLFYYCGRLIPDTAALAGLGGSGMYGLLKDCPALHVERVETFPHPVHGLDWKITGQMATTQ